ncbi:catalase [Paucibacter sp. XJ19-41]|uniref:catalase n=1 Tax=Paucibacter sp. XJ19-41 TaxID=2927824 RepID=UPI002349EAD7|nr:catalase [Paucibacter sp. XJ19-41]MDC6169408.1 catalase [Paucibacter sp. XJ19-41]
MKKQAPLPTPARTSGEPKAIVGGRRNRGGAPSAGPDPVQVQASATQALVASMPYNANKGLDFGRDSARDPSVGLVAEPASDSVSASTLSEINITAKTGAPAAPGSRALDGSLAQARVDGSAQVLSTNQGVPIADNQNSLKAGLRGPALLEDFILREKLTHFDHERIPERIVHARGSAAHGFFEAYEALGDLTCAAPFAEAGKVTPVFVRFSTVAGERGSADTVRDARGFAVKFYTEQGTWDLVGNNIPVFFIQDAMKFPDLVHAVKPEPHHAMPQAASAHDTFWDFASLSPETTHMLMWVMSDRAIPRSFRMMQGFGVHTFRLVTADGSSQFVKFHWKPLLGTHSLVWDEAVKIAGADADFHRRDLWEAIESGEYPEWELGLQLFSEEQAEAFSFDVLDATKLIPEELVPVRPVGRLVLNRNPDNFFAETEQVAFCTAHVVPGIDFSNDPLLAGRHHSYVDTQITRLGGANFHELPINASLAPVSNNQRDGIHRQTVNRGRVAYEPNSLGGGCPFQAGARGFVSFPQPVDGEKLRGKPEKFADHYTQATLFYDSQTEVEQAHIVGGFRFELSKLTVPAIRERMLASLVNVSPQLAAAIADGLGMALPAAMPRALQTPEPPEFSVSAALSLTALPGDGGIRSRKVAVLAAPGVEAASLLAVRRALHAAGAVSVVIAARLGFVETADGEALEATASFENSPAVLFDAVVLPDGEAGVRALLAQAQAVDFIAQQFRHGKTLLALGASTALLDAAHVEALLPSGEADPGVVLAEAAEASEAHASFIAAIGKHRHPVREINPARR